MGPRAGLKGRKISSPLGFDPGPSSPYSVTIPTELLGPLFCTMIFEIITKSKGKGNGKVIPLQTRCGPEGG